MSVDDVKAMSWHYNIRNDIGSLSGLIISIIGSHFLVTLL